MLFKLSALVLAAAALATASPAAVDKRGFANCVLTVTPSPNPPADVELQSEWNYLVGRTFAESLPSATPIEGTASVLTGPSADGIYTVETGIGSGLVTDAEATAIVSGWEGQTFNGPWSGVAWHIDDVVCA